MLLIDEETSKEESPLYEFRGIEDALDLIGSTSDENANAAEYTRNSILSLDSPPDGYIPLSMAIISRTYDLKAISYKAFNKDNHALDMVIGGEYTGKWMPSEIQDIDIYDGILRALKILDSPPVLYSCTVMDKDGKTVAKYEIHQFKKAKELAVEHNGFKAVSPINVPIDHFNDKHMIYEIKSPDGYIPFMDMNINPELGLAVAPYRCINGEGKILDLKRNGEEEWGWGEHHVSANVKLYDDLQEKSKEISL
jgi:hypothetical protein